MTSIAAAAVVTRGNAEKAHWKAGLAETHDAWARFSTGSSAAAVAVAGPWPPADKAAGLHRAMRRCEMIVVD